MSLALLRKPGFSRFFAADLSANFATGLYLVALGWHVMRTGGGNQAVGIVWAISIGCAAFALPLAGQLVDRTPRNRVLIGAHLLRALATLAVVALEIWGRVPIWLYYLLSAAHGVGFAFHAPATSAWLKRAVEHEHALAGNSLVEVSKQGGLFVAAVLAGVLYQQFGFSVALGTSVALFLVAALLLPGVVDTGRGPAPVDSGSEAPADPGFAVLPDTALEPVSADGKVVQGRSPWLDSPGRASSGSSAAPARSLWQVAGLRYLSARPALLVFGLATFLPFVATIAINVILPGFVADELKGGAAVYGWIDMTFGVGAFVAGLVAQASARRFGRVRFVALLFGLSLAAHTGLYAGRSIALACALVWSVGLAHTSLRVVFSTYLMEWIDEEVFGRVTAVLMSVSQLVILLTVLLLGRLADRWGTAPGFLLLGSIVALGAVIVALAGPLHARVDASRPRRRPATPRPPATA